MNFKNTNKRNVAGFTLSMLTASLMLASTNSLAGESANTSKAFVDFRLRYESVSQDNALKDADALTLRTLVHYQTKSFSGLSAVVEVEDSRDVMGVTDYNDTIGHNPNYSVIADPNTTELDQGFIQYKGNGVVAKVGRQVITFDGHRFVGHVGWRQDKQTFDAASVKYSDDKINASYAYIDKRNRIFAEQKDIKSSDHLFNVNYKFDFGKLTAYSYLLEVEQGTENSLDTYGLSFDGKTKLLSKDVSYHVEYATQTSESSGTEFDANYFNVEGSIALGKVKVKLGLESLGSDDGQYGFSTPLATLHKFNGWSDQFLGTPKVGLDDLYVSAGTKLLGGRALLAVHKFSANDDGYGIDDLGTEINAQYVTKFANYFTGGIKFSAYSSGDEGAGKVDTDKVWLWVGARF